MAMRTASDRAVEENLRRMHGVVVEEKLSYDLVGVLKHIGAM
jgi:hypothetical protein